VQSLGSPSNRINALAHWAASGIELQSTFSTHTLHTLGVRSFAIEKSQLLLFKVALLFIDVGFVLGRVRQWALGVMGTKKGEGFEDILQRQVTVSLVHLSSAYRD
jgi:aarF domain-containing kinase